MSQIPAEYRCAISGRIMLDPQIFDTASKGELIVDRVVAEKAEENGFFCMGGTEITVGVNDLWIRNGNLKTEINSFLISNGVTLPVLRDWKLDSKFRLKAYGEFQQALFPYKKYEELSYMRPDDKSLAESCMIKVLERTSVDEFKETIDLIEEALQRFRIYRTITTNDKESERRNRWPKVFPARVAVRPYHYDDYQGDPQWMYWH